MDMPDRRLWSVGGDKTWMHTFLWQQPLVSIHTWAFCSLKFQNAQHLMSHGFQLCLFTPEHSVAWSLQLKNVHQLIFRYRGDRENAQKNCKNINSQLLFMYAKPFSPSGVIAMAWISKRMAGTCHTFKAHVAVTSLAAYSVNISYKVKV